MPSVHYACILADRALNLARQLKGEKNEQVLFIWRVKWKTEQNFFFLVYYFTTHKVTMSGAGLAKARSQEFHLSLLHGWQEPKDLSHLLLYPQPQ